MRLFIIIVDLLEHELQQTCEKYTEPDQQLVECAQGACDLGGRELLDDQRGNGRVEASAHSLHEPGHEECGWSFDHDEHTERQC